METNETSEKNYINPNLENRTWLIGKGDISFIEYTRTDAFIDKAKQWFTDNLPSEKVQLLWCEFEQFITEN